MSYEQNVLIPNPLYNNEVKKNRIVWPLGSIYVGNIYFVIALDYEDVTVKVNVLNAQKVPNRCALYCYHSDQIQSFIDVSMRLCLLNVVKIIKFYNLWDFVASLI